MAVIQARPTHILYQCAKFCDDRTSFNVIFLRVRRLTCKRPRLCPYFDISGVKNVSHAKE